LVSRVYMYIILCIDIYHYYRILTLCILVNLNPMHYALKIK